MYIMLEDRTFKKVRDNPRWCNDLGTPCSSSNNEEDECVGCAFYRDLSRTDNIKDYYVWDTEDEVDWQLDAGRQFDPPDPFRPRGSSDGIDRFNILSKYAEANKYRNNWGDIDKVVALISCEEILREEYDYV